jgi:two-component system, LytTR family, sensor kinase
MSTRAREHDRRSLAWVTALSLGLVATTYVASRFVAPVPGAPPGAQLFPRVPQPPANVGEVLRILGVGSLVWYMCFLSAPVFFSLDSRAASSRMTRTTKVVVQITAIAGFTALTAGLQYRLTYTGATNIPPIGDYLRIGMLTGALPFVTVAAAMSALVALSRAHVRELEAARFRTQLAESRLEALTAQLQPHFLFNTLQGISTLILSDPPAADRMLSQLSDLLREVLRRGDRREVTLGEELRILDPYLAISRQRFGDRLSLRVEIDESLDRALVPFFILQPLVENALHHGIGSHAGPGAITVRATRSGDRMELTVLDDGPGHAAPDATRGIGLANTTARLHELYGSACSLDMGRRPEGGFRVRVEIPLRIP